MYNYLSGSIIRLKALMYRRIVTVDFKTIVVLFRKNNESEKSR